MAAGLAEGDIALVGVYEEKDGDEPCTECADITPTLESPKPAVKVSDAEYEHTHYNLIREKANQVAILKSEALDLKEMLAAKKKEWEGALAELVYLIRRDPRQQLAMPFDERKEPEQPAPVEAPSNGAWRELSLSVLGLPEKMIEKLNEASLISLGQLADYTAKGNLLTDVQGVGEASAQKIDDALDQFWAEHPEYCQPTEPACDEAAE